MPESRPAMLGRLRCAVAVLMLCLASSAPAQDGGDVAPLPDGQPVINLTDRGGVELHVADVPLSTVLQMLSLESKRNIITSPDVKGTVTANLYNVSFEEALEAILYSNGAGYRRLGNFVYVYTRAELEDMAEADVNPTQMQVFRLSYLTTEDAKNYIAPMLDDNETIVASPKPTLGIDSDKVNAGGNTDAAADILVVTARPAKLRAVERLLREIDIRPQQVLVEATILRAQLDDNNALGIDFAIVGGVDLQELGGASQGLTDLTLGSLPEDRFERFNSIAATDLASAVPDGGLTVGIIKDHVAVFLRALEEVTDTTVLANPKVLALNKQRGQVMVGRRDGFLTTTVTETQAIQTVEFLETGTQLVFRPFIGNDGFVRMELHPEDSVGFVNAQGLPTEQTTEVTTNVIVRDGETILIGGLFREVTTDAKSQIPGLGSIPLLGQLFRGNDESTAREEVIILLTVHIVKDHGRYASASTDLYEDIERNRVGVRQGLMWHGRERLSQTHYRKAWEKYKEGDTEKALWHANLALHNSSRMLPAIELKEKILQQRAWDDDSSGGRGFLHRLIAEERGDVNTPFDRPPRAIDDAGAFAEEKVGIPGDPTSEGSEQR